MTWTHKIFGFSGRLRRRDYWLIGIGKFLISVVLLLVVAAVTGDFGERDLGPFKIAQFVLFGPSIWVSIAIALKRCHDRDKGGRLGGVLLAGAHRRLDLGPGRDGFLDGTQGPNSYGKSPKGIGGDTDSELARVFA
jgi:uncharacterized membrane protein YhaH (DUF805 family)